MVKRLGVECTVQRLFISKRPFDTPDILRIIRLLAACAFAAAAPAWSDSPLSVPPLEICSLKGTACALRERDGRSAVVWRIRPGRSRVRAWSARIESPRLIVSDDGLSLVELYPGLNLLDLTAGPDTVVLVFHRPGAVPVPLRLRDVIARPSSPRRTASHRAWASTYGFVDDGTFVVETAEGHTLRLDPSTGQPTSAQRLRSR